MAKMGLPEEAEDPLFNKHQQLAKDLNLDEVTANQAWQSYQAIRVNVTLEGDDLHWLGCAIFVACRKTITPTISRGTVKGNPVSLTCLLRYCNLSLQQFFNKIVKWAEMADIHDSDFQQKIKHLEENFVVTCNIYKEFFPMYVKIFKEPESESVKHRNRKQKPPPCTPIKVFEFTWLLFITVKGKHPSYGSDIVTSYYFLQACLDLAFKNAFLAGRRDLLNPDFNGLPTNWSISDYQIPQEAPCIIEKLCEDKKLLTEAIYIKQYTFKESISDLFRDYTLQGDENTFTGLFDPDNFDTNFSNITKVYEQHILNEGDFDEKIFLAEYQRQIKLKNSLPINGANNASVTSLSCLGDVAVNNVIRDNASVGDVSSSQHCPNTPLTGKRYVGPKDQNETSLLQTVTQSISMLRSTLEGCSPEPSENLNTIIKGCTPDPTKIIQEVVDRLGTKFIENLSRSNENNVPSIQSEQDKKKLDLGITLFYKLLESILSNEKMINKDISPLVQKTIFFECLFACSLEIIIHSYNIPKKFPWILDISEVPPSYFVRVVELIVRTKDQLSRDTVKHLSCVEETILESLTWKGKSQLWDDIVTWGEDIPKFEDIALPGNMVSNSTGTITTPNRRALIQSPRVLQSPGPSAVDTFQSPINTVRPGQSLLQNNRPTHLMVTDSEGLRKFIPIEQSHIVPTSPAPIAKRPRKTGSLCIIFRKFYNLAWVRMDHLCSKLCINDIDLKRKIWTVFEHSVRETTLLKDRHLDQLLMCAVYVICKVTESSFPNFAEIMKCYRDQPQANSNIYRNVLIKDDNRSNLIEFYNNVYVPSMKNFVGKFSNSQNTELDMLLSPLPALKSLLTSPRHQVTKNVFIRPYESPSNPNLTGSGYSYYFSRSASKDLKDINKAINGSCVARKRILTDSTLDSGIPSKRINRKMQTLIEERKGNIVE